MLTTRGAVQGVPIDKVQGMSQAVRDSVGTSLLRLTLQVRLFLCILSFSFCEFCFSLCVNSFFLGLCKPGVR